MASENIRTKTPVSVKNMSDGILTLTFNGDASVLKVGMSVELSGDNTVVKATAGFPIGRIRSVSETGIAVDTIFDMHMEVAGTGSVLVAGTFVKQSSLVPITAEGFPQYHDAGTTNYATALILKGGTAHGDIIEIGRLRTPFKNS